MKGIIDKDFGRLTYLEMPNGETFWSGLTLLKNCTIDIFIVFLADGPTINQREFFKQIEETYFELAAKIYNVLPKYMKDDKKLADLLYFSEHFVPKALLIPNVDLENFHWSMTLKSTTNSKHFLVVEFCGFEPKISFLEK